ncbi:MAG: membrane protein required for colicin V production [Planctomycetota bacterium]|jgi:membrane protein required for colicin V production
MNTLDILILVVLGFNAILGAVRGAAWQILRLASIFLGVWGASRFGSEFLNLFPESWGISEDYGIYVARIVLFLSVYLVMFGITNLIKSMIQKVKLGSWDRALGAVFGAAKGALFCCVVLYLQLTPVGDIQAVQDQLHGNEKSGISASVGNDYFLKYARERIEKAVPNKFEEKVKETTKEIIDKTTRKKLDETTKELLEESK